MTHSTRKLTPAERGHVLGIRDEVWKDASAVSKLRSPLELHYFVEWQDPVEGEPIESLRQVMRDPRCDLGTAVMHYWKLCRTAAEKNDDALFQNERAEIEQRVTSRFYTEQRLSVDSGLDPALDVSVAGRRVPCELLAPTPGEPILEHTRYLKDWVPPRAIRRMRPVGQGLAPELEAQLLAELARLPGEDFDAYHVRSRALKERLLDQHGPSFMEVWLRHDDCSVDEVHAFDAIPAACPLRMPRVGGLGSTVRSMLYGWKDLLPNTVARLAGNTQRLFVVRKDDAWFVLYLARVLPPHGPAYLTPWVGGAPLPQPELTGRALKVKWTVPEPLAAFYAVHDGFGPAELLLSRSRPATGVLPCARLTTLKESLDEPGNLRCKPDDLLEFLPDGMGNPGCFLRHRTEPLRVVVYDHETQQLQPHEDFFTLVDARLVVIDESLQTI